MCPNETKEPPARGLHPIDMKECPGENMRMPRNCTTSPASQPGPGPDSLPHDHRHRLALQALMGPARELIIEHDGAEYVLRITRQNKLILTK